MNINALGKDAFLNLLTKQLQYQDPLKPMESTDFIAQLAQFRELESSIETNKTLSSLVAENKTMNNLGATGLLGRTVEVSGGSISHQADQSETISYRLGQDTTEVSINVLDQFGVAVKTLTDRDSKIKGAYQIAWDGRDRNGNSVPAGTYTYQGSAKGAKGDVTEITVNTTGEVSGLSYEEGGPFATVNGTNIKVGEIVRVLE
jgi:flagellar basal-body rod modification protein FlgD